MGILNGVADTSVRDAALASIGSKTTVAGAWVGLLGLLSSQEFLSNVGVIVAVLGFAMSWYYRHKDTKNSQMFREREDARAQEEHELRMKELRAECMECEVHDVK